MSTIGELSSALIRWSNVSSASLLREVDVASASAANICIAAIQRRLNQATPLNPSQRRLNVGRETNVEPSRGEKENERLNGPQSLFYRWSAGSPLIKFEFGEPLKQTQLTSPHITEHRLGGGGSSNRLYRSLYLPVDDSLNGCPSQSPLPAPPPPSSFPSDLDHGDRRCSRDTITSRTKDYKDADGKAVPWDKARPSGQDIGLWPLLFSIIHHCGH